MKPPTIRECLTAHTISIRKALDKIATAHGQKFWLLKSTAKHPVVTVVCHIDTVYDHRKGEEWNSVTHKWEKIDRSRRRVMFDQKHKVAWTPDGLGADDRAGVFGCFSLMSKIDVDNMPNFLFCDEEEIGCHGAKEAAKSLKEILRESLFFIELDRRNENDCVFYNDEPNHFVKYIEKFGFHKEWGSMSDIGHLGEETGLCGVNLSVGYYEEHTKSEYLEVNQLEKTLEKAGAIILDAHKEQKKYLNPKKKKSYTGYSGYLFDGYDRDAYDGAYGYCGRRDRYSYNRPAARTVPAVSGPTAISSPPPGGDVGPVGKTTVYLAELNEWMTASGY